MKRAAEHQLTKADIDTDREAVNLGEAIQEDNALLDAACQGHNAPGTTPAVTSFGFGAYANINPFATAAASGGGLFSSSIVDKSLPTTNSAPGLPAEGAGVGAFGFGAYAKINPFGANTTVSSFTRAPLLSGGVGSGSSLMFGSKTNLSSLNGVSTFDNGSVETSNEPISKISGPSRKLVIEATSETSSLPADESSFSSYTTKAPPAVTIPSPLTSSPKTQNPFSNPSPKHNPFVSIVESKDNLWSSASRSSSETTTSTGESKDRNQGNFPFPPSKSEENTHHPSFVTSSKITVEEPRKTLDESKSVFLRPHTEKGAVNVPNNNGSTGFNGSASEIGIGASASRILSSKEIDDEYTEGSKRVFGVPIVGGNEDEGSQSKCDDDNPVGDDECTEEQVYGKVYPMPDNFTVVTGEENEVCVIQVRAKLFRLSIPDEKMIASKKEHIDDHLTISIPVIPRSNVNILDSKLSSQNLDDSKNEKGILGNKETMEEAEKNVLPLDLPIKKKSAGEWIEVGIGPVRILKQRELLKSSPKEFDLIQQKTESSSDSSSSIRTSKAATSATRLVMRREDKKGGKGGMEMINYTRISVLYTYTSTSENMHVDNLSNIFYSSTNGHFFAKTLGTKLLLNTLLKGYINLKKQGDRMFHITCISGTDEPNQTVGLSTFMLQTKQPQVNSSYYFVIYYRNNSLFL